MKKILSAAIAAAMLTLASPAPAQALTNNDRQYLRAVRGEAPALRQISSRQLIDVARSTCRYLRSGASVRTVLTDAIDAGLTRKVAVVIIAGSIAFYCPDQEWKVSQ